MRHAAWLLALAAAPAAAEAVPPPSARPAVVAEVAVVEGFTVVGHADFAAATREAILLLKKSVSFDAIRAAVPVIEEHDCSGMNVYAPRPTFLVGEKTWTAGALWYAGAIAHDARHSQLYAAAKRRLGGLEPPPEEWRDYSGEQRALDYQAGVLRELGADARTLRYLEVQRADPRYQLSNRPARPYNPLQAPTRVTCGGRAW